MEHDDRTRAANLARLRKPKPPAPSGDQLPIPPIFAGFNNLSDLATALATSLDKLLALLDTLDMPAGDRHEIKDLRQAFGRDLSHFLELRGTAALSIAMQDLRAHLGLSRP